MKMRSKIMLTMVLPVLVIMLSLAAFNMLRVRDTLIAGQKQLIAEQLQKAALEIERDNSESVSVVRTLALAQQNGLFGKREETIELLRGVLDDFPEFIGASCGYEPNADGRDAEYVQNFKDGDTYLDADGRFLAYWFRDPQNNGAYTLEPLVDMESALYYAGVKEKYIRGSSETFLVTEPYVYNHANLIVEQMAPIIIDGRFMGICGIDRGLDFLDEFINKLKPYESAEFFLISSRGRIISTTYGSGLRTAPVDQLFVQENPGEKGRMLTDVFTFDEGSGMLQFDEAKAERLLDGNVSNTYRDIFQRFSLSRRNTDVIEIDDPLRGERSFIASAYIPTGGWRLVMTVSFSEIMAPTRESAALTFAMVGVTVLLIILIIWIFANSFSRRISVANELAQRVARGDLTAEVEVDTKDESGQLLQAIKDMVGSLNGLLLQVKSATIQLVSTATRITGTAKSQEATIQDFGASTTQIAAAVSQISATSRELLNTMENVSSSSSETAGMAETGRQQLAAMAEAMSHLDGATQSISDKLAAISDKASNITRIVTAINKVSEQTNLLSLNAAIEAEKAGEFGLGFAVVAREIRRLASQTAKATVDIDQMVKEMQSAVSAGVMEMDKFSEGVRGGVGEIDELSRQLDGIISRVQELSPRFAEVREGMQSQTQGAAQISDAMTNLKDGAQRSADSLVEFDKATQALHTAVNNLRREVSRFKVADRNTTGMTNMPFPMRPKKSSGG
ncbi:methyl-accepting chemotaxis protein [Ruficoccus amylovorans]|uniref:Methyl-accepting chemotaxis protein n=1 Tax=Ruficoccus amylovorans TaxID=1804625 RepID=A0A842HE58_9BACT|nr:methyl-accepting chemotaxis protein [Ruficoccus amylovorans]MBC2594529.1 methyl-accepting chemotaxis protein [Ruficoccus amylovorans]